MERARSGRAIDTREEVKSLNTYLDTLQQKVYEAYRSLLDHGEMVTAERIKGVLTGCHRTAPDAPGNLYRSQ